MINCFSSLKVQIISYKNCYKTLCPWTMVCVESVVSDALLHSLTIRLSPSLSSRSTRSTMRCRSETNFKVHGFWFHRHHSWRVWRGLWYHSGTMSLGCQCIPLLARHLHSLSRYPQAGKAWLKMTVSYAICFLHTIHFLRHTLLKPWNV